MSGRNLATIRVRKGEQTYVINQIDYRYPDNTVRPEWAGWKVISQADLTSEQLEVNAKIDAKEAAEKEAVRQARKAADAKLVESVPESGDELWAYLIALPNKGAVVKFAMDRGIDVDGGDTRDELNQAAYLELNRLAEKKQEDSAE